MSCDKCNNDPDVIMKRDCISGAAWHWGWGGDDVKITMNEAEKRAQKIGVFIDRGYLRMVDLEDCNCMDNGDKVEIKFCPFCGDELKYDENNTRIED